MGRSQETFSKKEVRNKKEKKRKDKQAKMLARKENRGGSHAGTIAYVDEDGNLSTTPPDPTKKKEIKLENIEIGTPKREEKGQGDPVRKGFITFFNDDKGYGFIKDIETQESIFVHVNNVIDEIKEGNKVSFEVMMGPKGPSATQVRVEG